MAASEDEAERLRLVALQNAQSIFLARQRAEEELVRTKEALERKTHELAHSQRHEEDGGRTRSSPWRQEIRG